MRDSADKVAPWRVTDITDMVSPWSKACLAAALVAIDPHLGGAVLRAGVGPVRDAWLAMFKELLRPNTPLCRVPLGIGDDRLFGGLDLAATLKARRPVVSMGVMAQANAGVLVLAMAERVSKAVAARIAGVLDKGEMVIERDGFALRNPTRFSLIALDEGQSDDEQVPEALADHLAFYLDLNEISYRDAIESCWSAADVTAARERLSSVHAGEAVIEALTVAAVKLGIGSFRAPLLALKAACAACALRGGAEVDEDDVAIAAAFVLAPRTTIVPSMQTPPEAADTCSEPDNAHPDTQDAKPDAGEGQEDGAPQDVKQDMNDIVLAAANGAIPKGLLEHLTVKALHGSKFERGGKAESKAVSARRGRPLAARSGQLREGRLSLVDTLRAAAPWQRLRHNSEDQQAVRRVIVRPEDFRIVRYRERRETTAIFVVDASGSSAMQRLAEVKGSIELLLADCYVRRDSVAMVVFRGTQAEVVLPPTRSLVRAKRLLAGLPGGGGTPLASGLDMAFNLADSLGRKGQSPLLVLMTDGRANIGSDGKPGRAQAFEDALRAGKRVCAAGIPALAIDTSPSLRALGELPVLQLGRAMNARYLQLPYADSAPCFRGRASRVPESMTLMQRTARHAVSSQNAMSQKMMSWSKDGYDWPNRASSRFVEAEGLRWHIQCLGEGPPLLLVHGTGAATHSWRALAPLLARRFRVIAPDLPGHGFTDAMEDKNLSLPGIAHALGGLLAALNVEPAIVIGHSAGAAILARLCIDRAIAPKLLVSLNGALLPFEGMAGHIFPPMAKLLFLNPLVPRVFAWSADKLAVSQLLRWTGSSIDRDGLNLYARLLSNPGHVAGALGMMAGWKLETLAQDLPKLTTPLVLVVAQNDRAVAPDIAQKIKSQLPEARVECLRGLGHLAHEEEPDMVSTLIFRLAQEFDVLSLIKNN